MSAAFQAGMHALERGAHQQAISYFQSALGEDPEDPLAHAMISVALSNAGRRYAAQVEARRAMSLDPELPVAHVADAYAHLLHTDYRAAARSFDKALDLEPHNLAARLGVCRMARARRDAATLEGALAEYRALAPDDPEAEVLAAHLHLIRGELDAAETAARAALSADPQDPDGYTALGWVHARRGEAEAARQMALTALNIAPEDRDAHHLLAQAVMQQRPFLGYWQRISLWLSLGGAPRIIGVLIGIWVAYRTGVVMLDEAGLTGAAAVLQVVWIALMLTTWIGGMQYRRMVERELERAELHPDY